tara:strand:+ start:942 stop:2048 length:1107 start_codon:yes stop_codon:yes gene_type:complete
MKVPFNNLKIIHDQIKDEVLAKTDNTISKNSFILSDEVKDFEQHYAKYSKSKYSVSCSNGTVALELVLKTLKKDSKKSEVLVPVNSFIATSFAVSNANLKPIFYDCDEYYLGDTTSLESKITSRTLAIIGVNLYGQIINLENFSSISKKYDLPLIIDGAQSHGSHNFKRVSEDYSLATTYSFYPGKNLGAWGDGGAVNTNSKELVNELSMMRNQGSKKKYYHDIIGTNARLDSLQANVLRTKLKYLDQWIKERNEIAQFYTTNLAELGDRLALPKVLKGNYHTYHLYVVRVKNRTKFINYLNDSGIETVIHYPNLISDNLAYKDHEQFGEKFLNASSYKDNIVSLPIFPGMDIEQKNYVVNCIKKFFK